MTVNISANCEYFISVRPALMKNTLLFTVLQDFTNTVYMYRNIKGPQQYYNMWLFKALVRPHLEYCTTVTEYEKDAKLLESVQTRATKMVPEMKNCDYATRLKKLALPSLSYRRKRGDMIEVYI